MMAMVHGSEWPLEGGTTVSRLLASMGLRPGKIVVELNGRILRRADFDACGVARGDRVEIVRFVGGG
jgi:thiamine biosynthesis protein ThiS